MAALGLSDRALRNPLFAEEPLALAEPGAIYCGRAGERASAKLIAATIDGSVALIGHGWFKRESRAKFAASRWRATSPRPCWTCVKHQPSAT